MLRLATGGKQLGEFVHRDTFSFLLLGRLVELLEAV